MKDSCSVLMLVFVLHDLGCYHVGSAFRQCSSLAPMTRQTLHLLVGALPGDPYVDLDHFAMRGSTNRGPHAGTSASGEALRQPAHSPRPPRKRSPNRATSPRLSSRRSARTSTATQRPTATSARPSIDSGPRAQWGRWLPGYSRPESRPNKRRQTWTQ